MTGFAKTLHSHTSDLTTLTSQNFKSTEDIALKFYILQSNDRVIFDAILRSVPYIKLMQRTLCQTQRTGCM